MLSEGLKGRDSLKLSFNRSISEPGHSVPMISMLSPPSVAPSLHPPKRCKIDRSKVGYLTPSAGVEPRDPSLIPPLDLEPGTVSLPTSPCSESSTLQRTLLLKQARTISCEGLAKRLEKGKHGRNSIILDCRPFIAYNVNHIRGAINVNCCDRFNRKRLQQGKASLADLATTKEGKEALKKRNWKEVVVYDDCTEELATLPTSHTLFLVMNSLVEDQRQPIMLVGGLRSFQTSHPGLCEDYLMRSPACLPGLSPGLPAPPSPSDIPHIKDIENHPASQITPFLFLGNLKDASDNEGLRRLGIDHVLNVTATAAGYKTAPDIRYKQLIASDNGYQNLKQYFDEAFEFIDSARLGGGAVLIHCQAGVSRSPTIAVAYLIKHSPMTMVEAYKFVKSRRSIISPNLNFMGQLLEFEQGLERRCTDISLLQPQCWTTSGKTDVKSNPSSNNVVVAASKEGSRSSPGCSV